VSEASSPNPPPSAGARSRLVRDASGYMAATYVSQVLAFGIGIVTKGLLGPTDLGIWTMLLAVLSFLGLLEFGVIQAANKEISYALSKGDTAGAERFKRVQFSFVTLTSVIGSIGTIAYALWTRTGNDSLTLGLMAMALILPISQLHMGQVTVYWANQLFSRTSLLIITETVLTGTVGLLLVWRFGVAGQVLAFLLILLVKIGALASPARGQPQLQIGFAWDLKVLRHLLRTGVPLLLINLSNVLKVSGTVFLIAHFFDAESVGFYSLALSVQNFIYWTPNAFSIVMFPRFQAKYANSNDQAVALRSYLVKPIQGLVFFLLPLLLSAAYFIVPALIDHALPAYKPTIAVLVVMLPGTFFLSLEHMPAQFLTTTNRHWQRVAISLLSLVLLILCAVAAAQISGSLLSFVTGMSVASFLAFMLAFCYAIHHARGPRSDRWLGLVMAGAFVYLAAVVFLVDRFVPASQGTWQVDMAVALGKWLLCLLLLVPLFAVAERKLELLSTLRNLCRNLVKRKT
jgi:O-antigen/teichoic acid export membrane protein